jgi:hypothetical protein
MIGKIVISAWLCIGLVGGLASVNAATSNLMVNGDFDYPGEPLHGWRDKFDLPGESWYFDNYKYVSVVEEDSRHHVLKLWGSNDMLNGTGQGTKVDSAPIPVKPGVRYKVSVSAKSDGPDCRILVEGYRWQPGIKPHANPVVPELRKCYKFSQLYFGAKKEGTMGGIGHAWAHSYVIIPEKNVSKMAQESLDQIKFYVLHIIAIGGVEGSLYVDDVRVEEFK